jgi:hypothetical protein
MGDLRGKLGDFLLYGLLVEQYFKVFIHLGNPFSGRHFLAKDTAHC